MLALCIKGDQHISGWTLIDKHWCCCGIKRAIYLITPSAWVNSLIHLDLTHLARLEKQSSVTRLILSIAYFTNCAALPRVYGGDWGMLTNLLYVTCWKYCVRNLQPHRQFQNCQFTQNRVRYYQAHDSENFLSFIMCQICPITWCIEVCRWLTPIGRIEKFQG